MSAAHPLMRAYEAARVAVYAHCGYADDWRTFPLSDATDQYWAVDAGERERLSYAPDRAVLERGLIDEGKEGDEFYSAEIYTYRHLKRWVFRGAELTIVLADTRCDGNVLLFVLRNDMEVRAAHDAPAPPEALVHDDGAAAARVPPAEVGDEIANCPRCGRGMCRFEGNHLMVGGDLVRIADGLQCLSPECGGTKNLRLSPAEGGSS